MPITAWLPANTFCLTFLLICHILSLQAVSLSCAGEVPSPQSLSPMGDVPTTIGSYTLEDMEAHLDSSHIYASKILKYTDAKQHQQVIVMLLQAMGSEPAFHAIFKGAEPQVESPAFFLIEKKKLGWLTSGKGVNAVLTSEAVFAVHGKERQFAYATAKGENKVTAWFLDHFPPCPLPAGGLGKGYQEPATGGRVSGDNLKRSQSRHISPSANRMAGKAGWPLVWKKDLGSTRSTRPVIADGVLYAAGDREFMALNAATGAKTWAVELGSFGIDDEGTSFFCGPSHVTDNLVLVATDGPASAIWALSRRDGRVLWSLSTGEPVLREFQFSGKTLYAANSGGQLLAADIFKGQRQWIFGKENPGASDVSAPLFRHELIYYRVDNTLYAVTESGKLLWKYSAPGLQGNPLFCPEAVMIIGDKKFYQLAARTGKVRQTFIIPASAGAAVLDNLGERILLWKKGEHCAICVYDTSTQSEIWSDKIAGYPGFAPHVRDGRIFVSGSNGVYVLDKKQGGHKIVLATENVLTAEPELAEGFLYVPGSEYLWALNADE